LDPIEKKPLYHFYPGSMIFSVGTVGCNLHCGFCQNWQIAQRTDAVTAEVTPEYLVELAREQPHCIGIAYTYAEPAIWYEYVYDTAKLAREAGLKNVLVTNGYLNPEPLVELVPWIDAVNLDVKAFSEEFYKQNCRGRLQPVLQTAEILVERCHLEITTLLIPGLNDSETELRELVAWIASLDRDIPLHFSRYTPQYQMKRPVTPLATLQRAREIALEKLNFVYLGNVWEDNSGSNTYCPACGRILIKRRGYHTFVQGIKAGKCINCGAAVKISMENNI